MAADQLRQHLEAQSELIQAHVDAVHEEAFAAVVERLDKSEGRVAELESRLKKLEDEEASGSKTAILALMSKSNEVRSESTGAAAAEAALRDHEVMSLRAIVERQSALITELFEDVGAITELLYHPPTDGPVGRAALPEAFAELADDGEGSSADAATKGTAAVAATDGPSGGDAPPSGSSTTGKGPPLDSEGGVPLPLPGGARRASSRRRRLTESLDGLEDQMRALTAQLEGRKRGALTTMISQAEDRVLTQLRESLQAAGAQAEQQQQERAASSAEGLAEARASIVQEVHRCLHTTHAADTHTHTGTGTGTGTGTQCVADGHTRARAHAPRPSPPLTPPPSLLPPPSRCAGNAGGG
jgi:hypothetical protein